MLNHVKKFNLQRHYTVNHAADYDKYSEEERKEVFSTLKNNASQEVSFGNILTLLC